MNDEPRAKRPSKPKTEADVVFCIDATGSMAPCIEGVKDGITSFVSGLQSAATVDYRLRLIAYRDLHDPTCNVPWDIYDFTRDAGVFQSWLQSLEANCGQERRGAESALDALYLALHSNWREGRAHRTVVLLTDDDSHATLHQGTYSRPDNGVERVIQDFQELRHSMLFMVAPPFPIYKRILDSMKSADRKIIANWVPIDDSPCEGLKHVDWKPLMTMVGQLISGQSVIAAQAR